VHTIVSFDFAISIIPGWHATIFPPYFVAGAIYGGFAMVLTIAIPLRWLYGLDDLVTGRHLDYMGRVVLATGLFVAYGYTVEAFTAWYSANAFEEYMILNRFAGPYAPMYWALIVFNVVLPQALWFERVRASVPLLFAVAMSVNVGMWLERYVIVVTSLHRDFLPSSWGMYGGTFWDWSLFVGSMGLFITLFLLFIRFLPMISIFEMRTLLPGADVREHEEPT
jgi:molybdopterin-containing oxidoreductase family membrane subunit